MFDWMTPGTIWQQFELTPSQVPTSGNVFGLAEYIASLALLLVIITVSDFRYRYRLAVTRYNLRKYSLLLSFSIGVMIILIDVWFQNNLPVPRFASNPNNLKAVIGLFYLASVFRIIQISAVQKIVFKQSNCVSFIQANVHFIHQGNADRIQCIAEELSGNLDSIFEAATNEIKIWKFLRIQRGALFNNLAKDFLVLIGDKRFCQVVADRVPMFAVECLDLAANHNCKTIDVSLFSRNVGVAFIINTSSAFYQEESQYHSGMFGYFKPITKSVFGSYELLERCANDSGSPLEIEMDELLHFSGKQMGAYGRAALTFSEDYLKSTKGQVHSYAFQRMINTLQTALIATHELNGQSDIWRQPAYERLRAVTETVKSLVSLLDKHAERYEALRHRDRPRGDIFDDIAELIVEIILASASVGSPAWTSWSVQHNTVWAGLVDGGRNSTQKAIAFKVRRLLYNEINRMDEFANFKGAKIIGFLLNIFGLRDVDRRQQYGREVFPLRFMVLKWTRDNYRRMVTDHPKVAESMIMGSITFDEGKYCLIKTYMGQTRKVPDTDVMYIS